jgi:hypothetical protein
MVRRRHEGCEYTNLQSHGPASISEQPLRNNQPPTLRALATHVADASSWPRSTAGPVRVWPCIRTMEGEWSLSIQPMIIRINIRINTFFFRTTFCSCSREFIRVAIRLW